MTAFEYPKWNPQLYCVLCKRWLLHKERNCIERFCPCEGDYICPFHKRGAYATKEDEDIPDGAF